MICQILCDFDGTIAVPDVTDLLLETFADPQWRDIEAEWVKGRIGSNTCMVRQVALMRCSRNALDALLDNVQIDPAFPEFVALCNNRGIRLTIVSDGLDYAINRILARNGLFDLTVVANKLLFLGNGRHGLATPHATATCVASAGTCKCATADRTRIEPNPVVLIGDGRSDFCASTVVDMVFAKGPLVQHCRAQRIPHKTFDSFADIPMLMAEFLDVPAMGIADNSVDVRVIA